MLEVKNTIIEMKNVFERLISTLNMAKRWIFVLENMIIEILQTEKQREKDWRKKTRQNTQEL